MSDARLLATLRPILQEVGIALGDEAARSLADAAARAFGDEERTFTFEHVGALRWIGARRTRTYAPHTQLIFSQGAWSAHEGTDAFSALMRTARPPLSDWESIARAYQKLVGAEILRTEEDARDYADPRWHALPWSKETVARWHPPRVQDGALSFCVEQQRGLMEVTVGVDFHVDVQPVTLTR